MIYKITDLILEYALQNVFASEEGRKTLRLKLYSAAKVLYDSDPISFDQATLMLLNENVPLLERDDYQAKQQSAQIWHKNGFDIWVFRIRFYLNISIETDTDLLALKIKKAFSCYTGSFMERHDIRRDYDWLFFYILRSNAPEDDNLRSALEKILSKDLVNDVEGAISYVATIKTSNKKQYIPQYMKTIYTVITDLSVIEGDGLDEWLTDNKLRAVWTLAEALQRIGLRNTAEIVQELYDFLKDKPKDFLFDCLDDPCVSEQIELFEKRLLDSFSDDELEIAAENYFRKHHKTH